MHDAENPGPQLRIFSHRHTLPRAVVIKKDRFEVVELAERAIRTARQEAEAIVGQAEADAALIREAAQREGYQEGRRAMAAAEVALRGEAVRLRAEAGERLLRLAVALAERVLGEELRTHPEALLALVRRALGQVAFCRRAVVRLNPEDARLLVGAYPTLAEVVRGGAELSILEDCDLSRGYCLVETEGGRVDGSVPVLLASLEEALLGGALPAVETARVETAPPETARVETARVETGPTEDKP